MTTAFVCFNWFQTVNNTNKQWNNISYNAATPVSLVDSGNVATGWSVTKPATAQGSGDGAGTVGIGDAAWVDEVGVIGGGWRYDNTSGAITHVISGLDNAKTYTLEFLGSTDLQANRIADVTIGGTTKQIICSDGSGVANTTETAAFTGVAPSSGEISFTVEQGAGSTGGGYLNAWYIEEEAAASDTTPPTFDTAPNVTATTETGHSISATLNEAGTIYGVRLANGATAPSSAQVKAGQDSTGSAAPEAKSGAAANSATLVFSAGSASTAYDYYIVAEDDEGTPNVQASPTLVEATTAAAQVPGISAITVQKDGTAVQAADWAINITLVSGGTEIYSGSSIASDASGVISAINTSGGSVGDAVRVEGYSDSNNYGFVFTQNLEDNA